jgi:prepilin-type processing-associated H-X9-DG protein
MTPPVPRVFFKQKGFNILETLVLAGVIAILVALLVPAYRAMQKFSKQAGCVSNLRKIVTAGISYTNDHDGRFPEPNKLINPWKAGGTLPGEAPEARPLNEYVDNNVNVFICPADKVPYPPEANAPAWAGAPFHQLYGASYFYNSYVGTAAKVLEGKEASGLYRLRMQEIKSPSKMVFFADQDARVFASGGANWRRLTLWWHSPRDKPLRANVAFVDGSVRMVDVVDSPEAKFTFFND